MSRGSEKRFVERPKRYELTIPVKLRVSGEHEWHETALKNVSGTGALVTSPDRIAVGAEIDVWLLMHALRTDVCDILCPSVVVRCDSDENAKVPAGIGMKFHSYKFYPPHA